MTSVPGSNDSTHGPAPAAELDEQIEIAAGRRAPYTQLADWVALSGISDHAKALYWHLKMHVNVERGDFEVWPRKELLAAWMQIKQARRIDPYIDELVRIGAIEVYRRRYANGMRARNRYVVHDTPPPGYTGPTSLAEWYARHNSAEDETSQSRVCARQPVVPSRAPRSAVQGTTARPAQTDAVAGQPVVPSRAPRSAIQGTSVVPSRALEQDEVQPDEPAASRASGAADAEQQQAASPRKTRDRAACEDQAAAILERLPAADRKRMGSYHQARLVRRLADLIEAGSDPGALAEYVTADLSGPMVSLYAVITARLREVTSPLRPTVAVVEATADSAPQCSRHPGAARRADGQCAGCWVDSLA